MLFETEINKQRVVSDVTPALGGKERAPTPPDLFVASIGACIAAFVANYCEKQGIDTEGLSVETRFEKLENPSRLTDFHVTVNLPHGDCGDRRTAVHRVADRCIIQETLSHLAAIDIEIRDRNAVAAADIAPA